VNAIEALLNRRSVSPKFLTEPGPTEAHLDLMLKAGARAADHGRLRPWRFVVVRGEARARLGQVFADARRLREPEVSEADLERERRKPFRAPLVLLIGSRVVQDNANVRPIDQVLAAGAAAQNVLLAAYALGYGAMWLTGSNNHDPNVKRALGFAPADEIVGSFYIGTPTEVPEPRPVDDLPALRCDWVGPFSGDSGPRT
jgi:nitroreductase